jgi:REP element-mobilizing transposase RayT
MEMGRPLRIEYPHAFYHITVRGNERKDIFRSAGDREQFLSYLASATERYRAVIHVYCLMSNHYHLLLETPEGNLSQVMRHINGAYTNHFNTKRRRAGHLLQGRYRAILVEADVYAKELSRYIHLNPVRAGITEQPGEYPWSRYRCYSGIEQPSEWLCMDMILADFGKNLQDAARER